MEIPTPSLDTGDILTLLSTLFGIISLLLGGKLGWQIYVRRTHKSQPTATTTQDIPRYLQEETNRQTNDIERIVTTIIENLREDIRQGRNQLMRRLDSVDERISGVDERISGIDNRVHSINDTVTEHSKQDQQRFDELERNISHVENNNRYGN